MAFQPTRQGYDVVATARQGTPPRANGRLHFAGGADGPREALLWVYEIQTGFAQAGSMGQSFRTRSYFPRSFVQPSFTVMCQCPNQEIYGDTIEFIRHTQVSFESSTKLEIGNVTTYKGTKLKGAHSGNAAEGYIKTVRRAHTRHEYSPELTFEFIVERYLSPSEWRDQGNQTLQILPTWKEVIEQHMHSFVQSPDPVQDQAKPDNPIITDGPNGQNRPN